MTSVCINNARVTLWARSSVGEHYLDTVGVSSSILLAPTRQKVGRNLPAFFVFPGMCVHGHSCLACTQISLKITRNTVNP